MKTFSEILTLINTHIGGHENPSLDDDYLKQFGISRLTSLRNTADESRPLQTELDKAQVAAGHVGCNDSSLQDFVCIKDGLQFLVFISGGIWSLGNDVYYEGKLLSSYLGDLNEAGEFAWEERDDEETISLTGLSRTLNQLDVIKNLVFELKRTVFRKGKFVGMHVRKKRHGWSLTFFHDETEDGLRHPVSKHDHMLPAYSCIEQMAPGGECWYSYPSAMGGPDGYPLHTNSMKKALSGHPDAEILYRYYDTIVEVDYEYFVWEETNLTTLSATPV